FLCGCGIEGTVAISKDVDFSDPQLVRGRAELLLAHAADLLVARAVLVGEIPAALAARRRDEERFHAIGSVARKRATQSQRLIVGVRENGEEAERCGHAR